MPSLVAAPRKKYFISIVCLLAYFSFATTYAQDAEVTQASSPMKITPEGVQALESAGVPFDLVDANDPSPRVVDLRNPVRQIYYSVEPSGLSAQERVILDRKNNLSTPELLKQASQSLTGTPLEWRRLALRFGKDPFPTKPLLMTPKQLSESIKNGLDIQIVDLRVSLPNSTEKSPFVNSLQLLPHQLEKALPTLSKQRWVVLIDGGDHAAQPIAEQLFRQGYVLTAVLDGGYPAWLAATER